MPSQTDRIATEDAEYLRHGDTALKLRLFKPQGEGPFPAVVDLHGGAWTTGDLADCQQRGEALAQRGILVAAANFRHAADRYPTSLADINYAIRWVKSRAGALKTRPDRVGIAGVSSGGHLAMLAAMRPRDPRYAALALPGSEHPDATVRCVAMLWPVINPLSRYRHAQRLKAGPNPPAWSLSMKERHDTYWGDEDKMAEGNPMLALERGEKVETPPALWFQGRPDLTHDYHDPDSGFAGNEPERFVSNYRKAGGEIELVYVDQEARTTPAAYDTIATFLHKHLR
ncbi:MAG: alpha/beta hydrolase [Alphaproteobacteria bacterium]|nr:alpha/beta hydrolase [Alphaproteobacteria bacterium]